MPSANEASPDIWRRLRSLGLSNVYIGFDVDWVLTLVTADVAGLLRSDQAGWSQSTSKVGMLCCPEFAQLVRPRVPAEACFLFQAMLYGTSCAYSLRPNRHMHTDDPPASELVQIAATAGDRFLCYLDRQLQPVELGRADLTRQQCLFVLVFGTILAVSYMFANNDQIAATPWGSEPRDAVSAHLCERLAHHLVILGRSIGALFEEKVERNILQRPLHLWDRKGRYSWTKRPRRNPYARSEGKAEEPRSWACAFTIYDTPDMFRRHFSNRRGHQRQVQTYIRNTVRYPLFGLDVSAPLVVPPDIPDINGLCRFYTALDEWWAGSALDDSWAGSALDDPWTGSIDEELKCQDSDSVDARLLQLALLV